MSQQPPLRPDTQPTPPSGQPAAPPPALRPDTGEPSLNLTDFIDAESGGNRACLWGCGSVIAFLVISMLICGGALLIVGRSVGDVFTSIEDLFIIDLPDWMTQPGSPAVPDDLVLPDVERLQSLAELTTMRFNYSNFITTRVDMPPLLAALYGDSLVLVAVGHIEAGIDLNQLSPEALQYDDARNVVTVQLPAPTIQDCFLNESLSYVVQRNTGIFQQARPDLDTASRRFAISQFVELALEDDILGQAATQAQTVMRELVAVFLPDGVAVEVNITPQTGDLQLPDACALPPMP